MSIHEIDGGITSQQVQASIPQINIRQSAQGQFTMESNISDKVMAITIMLDIVKALVSQTTKPELITKPNLMVAPN